jgi:mono/diheme cytochrome c family protein
MLAHFNMATFQDRESGDPTSPPDLFHPTALDTDQWDAAARSAKMAWGCLTTRHHDGFCICPTKTAAASGKELFIARCARCHNDTGDKPLKTGQPLNERGLSTDQIARAVSGRLRDKTEDERGAVTLYISSLMKTNGPEEKTPPKS